MKEIVEAIHQFNEERDWVQYHKPSNLAKSISIEANELLECFQWSDDFDQQHVEEELADVLIYCFDMARAINVDVKEIIFEKMKKNAIKYPK